MRHLVRNLAIALLLTRVLVGVDLSASAPLPVGMMALTEVMADSAVPAPERVGPGCPEMAGHGADAACAQAGASAAPCDACDACPAYPVIGMTLPAQPSAPGAPLVLLASRAGTDFADAPTALTFRPPISQPLG